MPRIRTIKPEFWSNEKLSELHESTHMLAASLLNYADDHGYFNANVALVKAACCPIREPLVRIPESLRSLQLAGYIRLGTTPEGRRIGQIIKFSEHQRVSHPTPTRFDVSAVTWDTYDDSAHPPETFGSPPESFRPERNREQGKEQGKELEASASCSEPPKRKAREPDIDKTPVVFEIRCAGTPGVFQVHQSRIDAWSSAFPGLAVPDEIRRAIVWMDDNPTRRKTAKGMAKFLFAWLSRAQDRGSGRQPAYADPNAGMTIQDRLLRKLASIPITDGSDRE